MSDQDRDQSPENEAEAGRRAPRRKRRRHGSLISTRPLPLPSERGRSRNPFRWLWHIWRYGWYHPDEDLLGVIDAAGDALRAQIASARAVLSGEALAQALQIGEELEDELAEDVPELANLLGFEARINALYPPAVQRRRAWMLRERFERVAPSRAVVEYWASNPPDPDGEAMVAEELRRAETALRDCAAARGQAGARCEDARSAVAAAGSEAAALKTAQEGLTQAEAALTAATSSVGLAEARCALARARGVLYRAQRALADAVAAARAAALDDPGAQAAAQSALDLARREYGAAIDAVDAREQALDDLGGPAAPASGPTPIDADAQTLLSYIHSSYMMSIGREKASRDLMRWLVMRFWSANAVAVFVLFIVFMVFRSLPGAGLMPLANLVIGLFFIAIVGRIGATMSVVQRLQRAVAGNVLSGDSLMEITRLRTGKNGINLALFSGAVFALLLYAIFATGAPAAIGFDNGIFPRMDGAQAADASATRDTPQTESAKPEGEDEAGSSDEDGNSSSPETNGVGEADVGNGTAGTAGPGKTAAGDEARREGVEAGSAGEAGNTVAASASGDKPATGTDLRRWYERVFDTAPSTQCKAGQPCDPFTQFADALGFPGRADFFKLLLWAFLAGFAERLVPDVLDGITRRTRAGVPAEEEAAAARRRSAAAGGSGAGSERGAGGGGSASAG